MMRTNGMTIKLGLLLLAAASCILASSCGLEVYPYLDPPREGSASLPDNTFSFSHDTGNDVPEFLGYEVYYKFYPENNAGEDQYNLDKDIIDNSTVLGTSTLTARGYRRINRGGDPRSEPMPLIVIGDALKDQSFTVQLDFDFITADSDAVFFLSTDDNAVTVIYREDKEGERPVTDSFRPADIEEDDDDIITMLATSDMNENEINTFFAGEETRLRLSLYALSFGREGVARTIYSEPEHLEYIVINLSFFN